MIVFRRVVSLVQFAVCLLSWHTHFACEPSEQARADLERIEIIA